MKRLILAFCLIGLCLLAAPQPARAFNLFSGVDCTKAQGSAICTDNGNGKENPLTGCDSSGTNKDCGDGLLMKITNLIAYIAGAAAVIMLMVGALRYVSSGSDTSVGSRIDDDVLNAKRTISQALIGLAIIVLAKTILNYVIKRIT